MSCARASLWSLLLITATGCPSATVSMDDLGQPAPGRDAGVVVPGMDAAESVDAAPDAGSEADAGSSDAAEPDALPGADVEPTDAGPIPTTAITLPYTSEHTGPQALRFTTAVRTAILVRAVSATDQPGVVTVRPLGGAPIFTYPFYQDVPTDQRYVPIYLEAGGDYLVEVDAPPDLDRRFLIVIEPITRIVPFPIGGSLEASVAGTAGTLGFTFTATQGDVVRLDNYRVCPQFNGIFYYQGLRLAEDDAQETVRQTGLQLVGVRKREGANCPGSEDFRMEAWVAAPVALGTPSAPVSLTTTNFRPSRRSFTFRAPAGTVISGKVSGTGYSYYSTTWFQDSFQDPTSGLFFSTFGPWVVTSTTPQVLDVEPQSVMSGASSDTVMRAWIIPPPIAVADPTVAQSVTLEAGEQRVFSFDTSGAWAAGRAQLTARFDVSNGQRASIVVSTTYPAEGGTLAMVPGDTRGASMGTSPALPLTAGTTYYVRVLGDRQAAGMNPDPNAPVTVQWSVTATP